MMNTPLSSTGQLARYIVAGPLVLAVALGFSAAQAQGAGPVVPVRAIATASAAEPAGLSRLYYLDGKPTTLEGKEDLSGDVATMKILKGAQVQQVLGNSVDADWAIMITTNKNRNRADVLALNAKVDAAGALDTKFKLGPRVDPAKNQLPAGIKAYIAKTYPAAKLTSWVISDKASAKSPYVRYLAGITEGNTKRMLYFNAEQQPVTPATKAATGQGLGAAARTELAAPGTGTAPSSVQTIPATPRQNVPAIYYLDGERQNNPAFASTAIPANIASIEVIKDERAQKLLGADAGQAVAIITTKANQNRADVVAFNEKTGVGVPPAGSAPGATSASPIAYLAAPALAYITKNYPEARLLGVTVIESANGGAPRYKAEIAVGRRPLFLVFDAQGQLIPR